jgi:hypothetical protein
VSVVRDLFEFELNVCKLGHVASIIFLTSLFRERF